MKKLLIAITAIMLVSCSQTKIAYLDIEELMSSYEATKELEAEMTEKQEALIKSLDSVQGPFRAKVEAYYKEMEKLSASKRSQMEQALQQEQQLLQASQQQATQALQVENQAKSEVITKTVDSIVSVFAKTNGYNLVLGTTGKGNVMYADDQINVTENILEVLNKEYQK